MNRFYLSTPIYYANDAPHVGSSYTTIAADVLARYHRRLGDDTFFLTGTDEHGAKVAEAAAARGISPQLFVDQIAELFLASWKQLDITNDYFVRTTDSRHVLGVQAFLQRLYDRGQIYKGKYEGLYCVGCEAYVSPDDLVDGLCKDHRRAPITYTEENWFFRLGDYQETLIRAITDPTDPDHYEVGPATRRNEVLGKLKVGLADISVSRSNLEWGIPLPFDPTQTCYVWVDALLNYITAIGSADDDQSFERYWPADLHLVGKDILWFHAIIWPAMLIAAGMKPPRKVFAHGFFTVNGQKMSKTLGNVITPAELIERYGVDASRYLLLSEFPFGTDGDVSFASLTARFNSELANDLGNLLNRTVSMVNRYFGGTVPASGVPTDLDLEVSGLAESTVQAFQKHLDALEFPEAVGAFRALVRRANKYVEETQPWALAKTDRDRLGTVMATLIEALRITAELATPLMPTIAEGIAAQLGTPLAAGQWTDDTLRFGGIASGRTVAAKPVPLFPKIEG